MKKKSAGDKKRRRLIEEKKSLSKSREGEGRGRGSIFCRSEGHARISRKRAHILGGRGASLIGATQRKKERAGGILLVDIGGVQSCKR